jgi:hypothetical protein
LSFQGNSQADSYTEICQGAAQDGRSWQLLPDRSGFVEEEIEVAE